MVRSHIVGFVTRRGSSDRLSRQQWVDRFETAETRRIFSIRITKNHTSQLLHFLPSLSKAFRSLSKFRDPAMAEKIRGRCTPFATTTCPGADDADSLKGN